MVFEILLEALHRNVERCFDGAVNPEKMLAAVDMGQGSGLFMLAIGPLACWRVVVPMVAVICSLAGSEECRDEFWSWWLAIERLFDRVFKLHN
jgi:hypothetical protein